MPISHKFLNVPPLPPGQYWDERFQTHNAIMDVMPYKPKVIFIGTFNPNLPWNLSDFFYGRAKYMWTVLANLFLYNKNKLITARTPNNVNPTLQQLFLICQKSKITFGDIITQTNNAIPTIINDVQGMVDINGFPWNKYDDATLNELGNMGYLDDNVDNLVNYITATPSILHVYFTFNTGNWLVNKKQAIVNALPNGMCSNIYTPTARHLRCLLPPYDNLAWTLAHHWVWNNLPHGMPFANQNYAHLNHEWLIAQGVNPNNF